MAERGAVVAGAVASKRADLDPPAIWLARVVALAQVRFPSADLGRSAVARLYPTLRNAWQGGSTPAQAEALLFTCDGRKIEIKEPLAVHVDKRPPKGAIAGEIFGALELRPPAAVERLKAQQTRLSARLDILEARRNAKRVFRRPSKDRELEQQINEAVRELRLVNEAIAGARVAPPPGRAKSPRTRRSAACPPSQAACRIGFLGGVCGLPAPLVLAAGQGAPVARNARFCLTSAARLNPSHLPAQGFAKNPSYPPEVQERAYDRDKAEQIKVIGIAQNLVPELVFNGAPGAIDGLPVVTEDGIVLGGNGRTMALQLHYAQGGTTARTYLLDHARQFGFTREQIAALPDPVVVRVIETSANDDPTHKQELQRLVRLLNVPLLKSLDARSESVAEARRLPDEVLEILSVALLEETSLSEYLSSPASRTLARALRRAEILTDANAVRLLAVDGQSFSDEGRRFVERILLASLIPDADILDRLDGRVRESLARAAPWFLSAAAGGEGWDLRPALRAAAADLLDMRRQEARSVDAFLAQTRIGEQPAVLGVPLGVEVLRMLVDLGAKPLQLSRLAQRFANYSRQHPTAQGSLLAEEKLTPPQALARAGA